MGKDIPGSVAADSESTSYVQAQEDAFAAFMAMPVTKLDADQYLVSDLDGVTEGLFGSGNMNFLMMQAGQTNDSINAMNDFDMVGGMDEISPLLPASFNGGVPTGQAGGAAGTAGMLLGSGLNDLDNFGRFRNDNRTTPGGIEETNTSTNTQSSSFFSTAQNIASVNNNDTDITRILPPGNPINGTSGLDGISGNDGDSGTNGTNGNNGANGTNGIGLDGVDGEDGRGLLPPGPVGLNLSFTLDNITNLAIDIISGDNIINVLDEVVDLSPVLQPVDDLLGNIAAGLDLGILLNPFQYDNSPNDRDLTLGTDLSALGLPLLSSLDNLHIPLDPVEGLLGDLDINLDIGNELLADLLGGNTDDTDLGLNLGGLTSGLPLDIPLGAENILLNPVEDLLGDIDIGITPNLDLFNTSNIDNANGDTDITIPLAANLLGGTLLGDALHIELDPVEAILGDIDLDIVAGANLLGQTAPGLIDTLNGGTGNDTILSDIGAGLADLGATLLPSSDNNDTDVALGLGGGALDVPLVGNAGNIVLNPVEDLVGDVDLAITPNIDLFNTANTSNAAGDTDITIPLDIALLDDHLATDTINLDLDPLEQITGDIDLDVTAAADLLGNAAGNLIDPFAGGSSSPNLISDIGDGLSTLGHGILPSSDGESDIALGATGDLLDTPLLQDGGALSLDPVEHFVGDIDLGILPSLDLLGTATSGGTDSDLSIPLDVALLGGQLADQTLDINLDLVESIAGDIDLSIPLETNLLQDPGTLVTDTWEIIEVTPGVTEGVSTNLVDSLFHNIDSTIDGALNLLDSSTENLGDLNTGLLGGNDPTADIGMWTESILPDAGNILGGGLGAIDIASILPDPIASTPVVPITAPTIINDTLSGAGLGGGRHFGGLFG